jgi:uncharacterized repeat protein (TIGR03803 family)
MTLTLRAFLAPRRAALRLAASLLMLAGARPAAAGGSLKETVLTSFGGSNTGEFYPMSTPVIGAGGVLYGTTSGDGDSSFGTVFAMSPAGGAVSRERVLYGFGGGDDGAYPVAGVVTDLAGTLYGTTRSGGAGGCGTVYQLAPPVAGSQAWTHSVLYSFLCAPTDGQNPVGGLILDRDGAPAWAGGAWTESILYAFQGGSDGAYPTAALLAGPGGTLLGTTSAGGGGSCANGCGGVFMLAPAMAGGWTESMPHRFTGGADGAAPLASLAADGAGALYGTTSAGGVTPAPGDAAGTVFRLMPPATEGGEWSFTTLYTFTSGDDGASPQSALVVGKNVLYGTAAYDGSNGSGTAFKLSAPARSGAPWSIAVLHGFGGPGDGAKPLAGMVASRARVLYGTTFFGGADGDVGTVFSLSQ